MCIQARKFLALSEIEDKENQKTQASISKQLEFAEGFRVYAANILVNVVYKVCNI
jgi:hypothetical protein